MATDFFTPYAQGGAAARADSFTGLTDPFSAALQRMLQDAPSEIQIGITSAYRSPEVQERLWQEALAKYGSEAEARKWVAPPGKSQHNHGNAADLKFLSDGAKDWVHQNAARYGLAFPLSNEDWHIELAKARGAPALGQASGPALSGVGYTPAPASNTAAANYPAWITRMAQGGAPLIAPPEVTFEPLTLPTRRRA